MGWLSVTCFWECFNKRVTLCVVKADTGGGTDFSRMTYKATLRTSISSANVRLCAFAFISLEEWFGGAMAESHENCELNYLRNSRSVFQVVLTVQFHGAPSNTHGQLLKCESFWWWYPTVVSVIWWMMSGDAEHLCRCIYFSEVPHQFKSCVNFLIGLFICLLLWSEFLCLLKIYMLES